ncbi:23S rRNA (guanosine-2'-O-)-methyltransferase RlmB [Candidatus Hepatincola sp. Av]
MLDQGIWIYGYHSVINLLKNNKREIIGIIVTEKNFNEIKELILNNCKQNLPLLKIKNMNYFKQILPEGAVHQGYAIQVKPLVRKTLHELLESLNNKQNQLILILDQVTDTRNIGAIIRSAVAFDANAIILLKDHSPKENALMSKAAAGGLEQIDIIEIINLQNTLKVLKEHDFWIVGLDSHSSTLLDQIKDFKNIALVLGAEDKGIRPLTKKSCDVLACIPMNSKKMESLNISNAAAIALYELYLKK